MRVYVCVGVSECFSEFGWVLVLVELWAWVWVWLAWCGYDWGLYG